VFRKTGLFLDRKYLTWGQIGMLIKKRYYCDPFRAVLAKIGLLFLVTLNPTECTQSVPVTE